MEEDPFASWFVQTCERVVTMSERAPQLDTRLLWQQPSGAEQFAILTGAPSIVHATAMARLVVAGQAARYAAILAEGAYYASLANPTDTDLRLLLVGQAWDGPATSACWHIDPVSRTHTLLEPDAVGDLPRIYLPLFVPMARERARQAARDYFAQQTPHWSPCGWPLAFPASLN